MRDRPGRVSFSHARFVLSEGEEDAAFTRAIISGRNLATNFDVSPNVDIGQTGGNSGFGSSIFAAEPMGGFTDVTDVLILADNDDDPTESFADICRQIEDLRAQGKLSRTWGAATQVASKAAGNPSITIWMWPAPGEKGCLETLLWRYLTRKCPKEVACVEAALKCSGADQWPISKADKARVRCFLSIVCKRSPAISLSLLWRNFGNMIPVTEDEFTPFFDVLRAL